MLAIQRYRSSLLISLVLFMSACATRKEIPAPIVPVPKPRQLSEADGITAPSQKAWQWDANRYFTAELDHNCMGPIRFVDANKGIDTFVGNNEVPTITLASDDPDVVLAPLAGYRGKLVFSTDGGRHFFQEVRSFPMNHSAEFVIVRGGQVYVGMRLPGLDGYFKWQRPGFRSSGQDALPEIEKSQLVILAAPLDKAKSRIGAYVVVAPVDYQFRSKYAEGAREHIKRLDNIESLGLPHSAQAAPSDACGRSLKLPPWSSMMDKEELLTFYNWYEAMKVAHPGWADAKTDYFIAWHRNWHRAALIPGAKTPTR